MLAPALLIPGAVIANFGDLYTYHYPLRHLAASSLQSGRLPFWNPYIFCGIPLAANPQAVLFYPLGVLGSVMPLCAALSWDYAFHLLWAGLGMMLLARRERLPGAVAVFLGALFAFSPFLVYRITAGIPTLLAALSWAPWCWLAFLSRRTGLLAAVWALQMLSGHPQFMVVNALGMAVWSMLRPERARLMAGFVLEGAAAAALAAVQWPLTWQFLGHSLRQDWPRAYAAAYSVSPAAFATWAFPGIRGNPMDGTFSGVASVFFESSGVYIGWLGLAAAAAGLAWGVRPGAVVLIGLGAFLALGDGNPLYRAVCPAGWLRTPARYLFLSLWGLILAAGAGARLWWERRRPRAGVAAFLAAAAAAQLLAWDHRFVSAERAWPYLKTNPDLANMISGRPFRVLTDPELANPNKTMLYRAMNANGYDAFYLRGYAAFASKSEGRAAADSSRIFMGRHDTLEMRRAAVAYKIGPAGQLEPSLGALPPAYFVDSLGQPVTGGAPRPGDVSVLRSPRAATFAGPSISMPRPERWLVEGRVPAGARGLAVTVPAYPGWRAWLDGKAAGLEPSGYFQVVRLPAESSGQDASVRLWLDFSPTLWPLCAVVALLAWLGWLGLQCARLGAREPRPI